jgi:hypothetical protein
MSWRGDGEGARYRSGSEVTGENKDTSHCI